MANDPIACSRAISDFAYERANAAELESYAATTRGLGAEPPAHVEGARASSLAAAMKHRADVVTLCGRDTLSEVDDASWLLGQARGAQHAYRDQANRLSPARRPRNFLEMARQLDATIKQRDEAQYEAQGRANPLAR